MPPAPLTVLANDFRAQWAEIEADAQAAMTRVGRSGWLILGEETRAFEEELARAWGLRHAVGVGNGMDAIELALRAAGLEAGTPVLTTPLSAFATTLAIVRAGGHPVFVDVDEAGLLDLDAAEEWLRAHKPRAPWMVPVHLYGHCLDLERLERMREKFGLRIVEDCAQSMGACWKERPCGTVGMAAATSFYPTKNLGALGDGGAILTDDADLAARCRQWRDYGQSARNFHDVPGANSRLDELHAAILRSAQLPRLGERTARRAAIAARYRHGLAAAGPLEIPRAASHSRGVWHLFPVLVKEGSPASLARHLQEHGIQSGFHYPRLIPEQPALRGQFSVWGALEQAHRFARNELSLPIHPWLDCAQVDRVIDACLSWQP